MKTCIIKTYINAIILHKLKLTIMKKILFLLTCCLLFAGNIMAQTIYFHENFESPSFADSLTSTQTVAGIDDWAVSNALSVGGQYSDSCTAIAGGISYLTSDPFSTLGQVYLDFDQICKTDFLDIAKIEISLDSGLSWDYLSGNEYMGGSPNFATLGNRFCSASYDYSWDPGNSYTIPNSSWWRHEKFNLSAIASNQSDVMIRFKLQDGGVPGPYGNYGWLIDNIFVTSSPTFSGTVSIVESNQEGFSLIYPNPATDEIFISNETIIKELNIYNQIGQRVLFETILSNGIDISMLKHGMYVIEVVSEEFIIREKLIIE